MRVLRLEGGESTAGAGPSIRLTLHPMVTVIVGASGAVRQMIIEAFAGLPRGQASIGGVIEVDHAHIRLDTAALNRLELRSDLDVVVRSTDLPAAEVSASGPARVRRDAAAAREDVLRSVFEAGAVLHQAHERRDQLQAVVEELRQGVGESASRLQLAANEKTSAELAERRRLDAEIERLRAELASALAISTEAEQAVADARERRRQAVAAATAAAAALEEVRGSADPRSQGDLGEAEQRRATLEDEARDSSTSTVEGEPAAGDEVDQSSDTDLTGGAGEGGTDDAVASSASAESGEAPEPVPLVNRIAELEALRDDLQRRLFALSAPDPTPVRTCLDRIDRAEDPEVRRAAPALADAWRDLHLQLAEFEATETDDERHVRARLEAARLGVSDAEQELSVPDLQSDQVDELEAAHAAVLAAQKKADSFFSGVRALTRLEQARAAERKILDELGFTTYAAYMMSSSTKGLGAAQRAILDTARRRLSEAEAEWEALGSDAARERRRAALIEELSEISPRIASLLGHGPVGPGAEHELRALSDGSAAEAALSDLRFAVTSAGIDAGEELTRDELVGMASRWLEEDGLLSSRREMLDAELRATDDQLVDLWQAQERGEITAPSERGDGSTTESRRSEAKLAEARAAEAAARERLAQHRTIVTRVTELESALAARTADEHMAAAALGQAERALVDSRAQARNLEAQIADLEAARQVLLDRERTADEQSPSNEPADAGAGPSIEVLLVDHEAQLVQAQRDVVEAELDVERLRAELAQAETRLAEAIEADETADQDDDALDPHRAELIEETEWYLLARLAAQRSIGAAGSIPLVLDDTFRDFEVAEAIRLVEQLERMSSVVQLILVTDDQALSYWAQSAGEDRAAVVSLAD